MNHQELVSAKYWKEIESPVLVEEPAPTSTFDPDVPYTRTLLATPIFIAAAAVWFFILPYIQAALIPEVSGGAKGPWLIRPTLAARVAGSLFLGGITYFAVTIRLRKKWKEADALTGRPAPSPIITFVIYLFVAKYLAFSGLFLATYLFSWSIIRHDGIDVRMPWGTRSYSFAQVRALRLEPLPFADENEKYGYEVQFFDGQTCWFIRKTEGLTEADLSVIVPFLAKQTGKNWQVVSTAKRRRR